MKDDFERRIAAAIAGRRPGPTRAELDAIEAEQASGKATEALREQLPCPLPRGFDMSRGDVEPPTDGVYGRRRIVWRLDNVPAITRETAEAKLAARGVVYTELFATARYWCAAVTD